MTIQLLSKPIPKPEPAVEPLLYTREEAARMLCLSLRTIDQLTKQGELPFVRFGRAVRFLRDDLLAFIQQRKTTN